MKQGWRWYGEGDAISLREIRQAGVTDVVAALYGRKPGEVWPVKEIKALAAKVEAEGMTWSVVESVPVHENIKRRSRLHCELQADPAQSREVRHQDGLLQLHADSRLDAERPRL